MSEEKRRVLDLAAHHVCPNRVQMLQALGVDLVIGRREGYRIWDLDGRELLDFHLNGGVFNLGHRNAELIAALRDALDTFDIGNHHFPSTARAELAAALARTAPGDLQYAVFAPSGSEAIEIAIKTARHATKRRTVVSAQKGYHGHTGLALAAGDQRAAALFLSQGVPGEFVHVPFNDLPAMEEALRAHEVAAVVLETIPATSGFPMPEPGYLRGVKALCERHGAVYVADEVQTGLGRTGPLWACEGFGVEPDILVTGKGLSGGVYPIAAALLSPRVAGWLHEDGWGHVSTFGGAELGCRVALKVLEITTRPGVAQNVLSVSERLGAGLEEIRRRHSDWFLEVRRCGVVMGLRFAGERGAMLMAKCLYEEGIWAMFAGFEPSVLQFKPGLLVDAAYCNQALQRFEAGIERCVAMRDGR
jgi:acetylornithine/succinyldiaminopimelate/putrescine aminotransferase